jgi:uncharacterized protein DUF4105
VPSCLSVSLRCILAFWFLMSACGAAEITETPELTANALVSLITLSPGNELYQAFGHSAIRIADPELGFDRMYNYGEFDFATEHFYLKFARGDLLYTIAVDSTEQGIGGPGQSGQGVTEVVLNLPLAKKQQLFERLELNLLPENRFYRYDFFLDNCSTRVRDVLESVLGFPLQDPTAGHETFRQMIDSYMDRMAWTQFGLSLALGTGADRVATRREACFLPKNLENAVKAAKLPDGTNLVGKEARYYPALPLPQTAWFCQPVLILTATVVVWIAIWTAFGFRAVRWLSAVVLIAFGAVGCFLLLLWCFSLHWEVHSNLNLWWLFPLSLFAGIALCFSHPAIEGWLQIYLRLFLVALLLFVLLSAWLPQRFNPAVYPLVALLACRTALEGWRKRVRWS